ncbi:hypothetical protein [Pseudomonas sp. NPDC089569]|uniref:hypothetical protein n=1 Tax=Pseudomonas sp. NPDC089569 TaxID=3390722 RepID=UPI003CFC151E
MQVVEFDKVVEESVVLLVESVFVKCFVSCCYFKIEVGGKRDVEFEVILPDGDCVALAQEAGKTIEMLGSGFGCILSGYLDGDIFRSFIDFMDQGVHYDYPQLNEQYVKINVERIDVAF